MTDKPYNKALFKAAMGIVRDNRQRQRNAMQAQQNAATIGAIGNAVTGVIGAYQQRSAQQKQQAAQDSLAQQLDIDPVIARQLDPASLTNFLVQQKNRGYISPTDAAQIKANEALAADRQASAQYEAWKMSPEGIAALGKSSGAGVEYVPLTPELEKAAGGLKQVPSGSMSSVLNNYGNLQTTSSQPKTSAQIAQALSQQVANDPFLKAGQNRYLRRLAGDTSIPENDEHMVRYRSMLPVDQLSADANKMMDRQQKMAAIEQRRETAKAYVKAKYDLDEAQRRGESAERIHELRMKAVDIYGRLLGTAMEDPAMMGPAGYDDGKNVNTYFLGNKAGEMVRGLFGVIGETPPATGQPTMPNPAPAAPQAAKPISISDAMQSYEADGGPDAGYSFDEYVGLLKQRGYEVTDG